MNKKFNLGQLDTALGIFLSLIIIVGMAAAQIVLQNSINIRSQASVSCLLSTNSNRITITSPNTTYTLCNGNDYSGGIDISVSNVSVDGTGGPIIDGGGKANLSGIKIQSQQNINIKNVTVKGFYNGLEIIGPNSNNITVDGGDYSGNSANSPAPPDGWLSNWLDQNIGGGIYFQNVSSSKINGGNSHNNIAGVTLKDSQNIEISGGDYSNNSGWGIRLINTTGSNIHDTIANNNNRCLSQGGGCESAGILLINGSNNNTINHNQLSGSGDGFYINGCNHTPSNNNQITNNIVNQSSHNAYEATFSTGNNFDSNTANNADYGFWLGYSNQSIINNSTINSSRSNGIDVQNSLCNGITQNHGSGNINLYPHSPNPNQSCEVNATQLNPNIIQNNCSNNYIAGNIAFTINDQNCSGDSASPIPSCNLPVNNIPTATAGPSPTAGPNPTNPPNNTPPPQNSPPPPQATPLPSNQGGSVTIEIHVGSTNGPLWTSTNPYVYNYADPNAIIIYLTGPDQAPSGFGEKLIIPGTTSGTTCTGGRCTCRSPSGFVYECAAGTVTWRGAYNNPSQLPTGNAGTMLGQYTVSFVQTSSGLTSGNSAAGTLSQVGTNLKLVLIVTQANNPTPTPAGPSPTLAQSPQNYTNADYDKVIQQYSAEQISPLTVSQWLSQATRVPGLQKAICYPPNCEFVK